MAKDNKFMKSVLSDEKFNEQLSEVDKRGIFGK